MSLESFIDAYMECAVWISTDDDGTPLDHIEGDLSEQALAELRKDAAAFYGEVEPLWRDSWWTDEQAGHDFWLTRNGHGAGFWARGQGALGDRLARAAKAWGSAELYVGDDGAIYHA